MQVVPQETGTYYTPKNSLYLDKQIPHQIRSTISLQIYIIVIKCIIFILYYKLSTITTNYINMCPYRIDSKIPVFNICTDPIVFIVLDQISKVISNGIIEIPYIIC